MKQYLLEIISLLFSTAIFLAVYNKLDFFLPWEIVILIFFLFLLSWVLVKRLPARTFYGLSLIYIAMMIIFEFFRDNIILEYTGIFVFYSLVFGLIVDMHSNRKQSKAK